MLRNLEHYRIVENCTTTSGSGYTRRPSPDELRACVSRLYEDAFQQPLRPDSPTFLTEFAICRTTCIPSSRILAFHVP